MYTNDGLVVDTLLGSSVLSAVGDSDLASGSRDTLDLDLVHSDRLNNLGLSILEGEDTAVVVVQNHDGGHVGGSELGAGLHGAGAVISNHVDLLEGTSVLAAKGGDTDIEVLVLLKHVIVKNLKSHVLAGLAGSEGQGSDGLNVVSLAGGGAVLGLVVHLHGLVHVSALTDNGDLESSSRLHDGVVRGVKEDAANSIVPLLKSLGGFSSGGLLIGLGGLSLCGELLLESLASILLSSHLAGSLGTVVGTGLGSIGHDLFPGSGLKVNQADVGVLEPDPLHGLNVGTTAALKLSQGRVHVLEILVELLLGAGLNVSSLASLQDNSTLVALLVKILVEEHALVSDKGHVDCGREEKEGQDALPGLDNTVGDNSEDEVEPDIGEHTEALNPPDLVVGDDVHAETDDHEQVEGSRADNCSGSEVSSLEVLGHDLNDGQHDLGCGRSQSHEGQVGNSVVPDLDNDNLGLAGGGILDGDLLLLGSD